MAGDQEQKFYMVSHKQEQRGTLRLKKRLDYERHSEQKFNLTLKVLGSYSQSPVRLHRLILFYLVKFAYMQIVCNNKVLGLVKEKNTVKVKFCNLKTSECLWCS